MLMNLSINAKALIAAGALALSAASSHWVTANYYQLQIAEKALAVQEARKKAAEKTRELELTQLELAGAVIAKNAAAHKKLRILTREITTEVIKYVQDTSITRCDLPPQFVRIHNSAASGRMSEDTGASAGTDGTTRRFTDAEVIEVVTNNYAICAKTKQDLISLQEYARSLQALNAHRNRDSYDF